MWWYEVTEKTPPWISYLGCYGIKNCIQFLIIFHKSRDSLYSLEHKKRCTNNLCHIWEAPFAMATKMIHIRTVLNIQPENEKVISSVKQVHFTIWIWHPHLLTPSGNINWKGLSGLDWHSYCLGKSLANKKNWQWQLLPVNISSVIQVHFPIWICPDLFTSSGNTKLGRIISAYLCEKHK